MAKSKKSHRSTRATKRAPSTTKGSREGRREKSLPPADRDPVVRAIVASARYLGSENPMLFDAIQWCLGHKLYLEAVYGSDAILRECMDSPCKTDSHTRDEHIRAVLAKFVPDGEAYFESTRQTVYRRLRLKPEEVEVECEWQDNRSFMDPILQHLDEEPVGKKQREIARANGCLLEWYV